MGALPELQIDAIAAVCRRHQVLHMHVFGSALREATSTAARWIGPPAQVIGWW